MVKLLSNDGLANNIPKARVLIVDDDAAVRQGLSTILKAFEDFELIGTAAEGQEAIIFCAKHQPDLVFLDLAMPIIDGAEITRLILAVSPKTKILIFTGLHIQTELVQKALLAGASDVADKGETILQIIAKARNLLNLTA